MGENLSRAVYAAIAAATWPLVWALLLAILLWLGRRFLSDSWGRILFGERWYGRKQKAPGEQPAESLRYGTSELAYRLGQQAGRWIRRK